MNDRNSIDGSQSNFVCNLSNIRSIEKRISAHKNGGAGGHCCLVSQSLNKTHIESSNVDVLDCCMDDVSKFSQSQIFFGGGGANGSQQQRPPHILSIIPQQLSARKDRLSNMDDNALR